MLLSLKVFTIRSDRWPGSISPNFPCLRQGFDPPLSRRTVPRHRTGSQESIPRLGEMSKKPLARRGRKDSSRHHDWRRLSDSGGTLTELARDGLAEHRLARRANALVLLDRGMSCEDVGRVLLIDDDTIRTWHRLFEADGVDGLAGFKYGGRAGQLTLEQQVTLKAWVGDTLPRTTRSVD